MLPGKSYIVVRIFSQNLIRAIMKRISILLIFYAHMTFAQQKIFLYPPSQKVTIDGFEARGDSYYDQCGGNFGNFGFGRNRALGSKKSRLQRRPAIDRTLLASAVEWILRMEILRSSSQKWMSVLLGNQNGIDVMGNNGVESCEIPVWKRALAAPECGAACPSPFWRR